MERFDRLLGLAQSFNCDIKVVDEVSRSLRSPFSSYIGLNWTLRTLYVSEPDLNDHVVLCGLIHELGHTVASKNRPEVMLNSKEYDFFGWEMIAARKCLINQNQFREGCADYHVGENWGSYKPIKELNDTQFNEVVKARLAVALEKKLITQKGRQYTLHSVR